jgi:hypothetical protein
VTVPSSDHRFAANDERFNRKPFLETFRALNACVREFTRLSDELVEGVATLHASGLTEKPVVRQSPGRCIVQLGPVAVTVAWLHRYLGPLEEGELLVVVWRGSVAPRGEHSPQAVAPLRGPDTPVALWEQTLAPVATSEATWRWESPRADVAGYSSTELAAQCVERLRGAYSEYAG